MPPRPSSSSRRLPRSASGSDPVPARSAPRRRRRRARPPPRQTMRASRSPQPARGPSRRRSRASRRQSPPEPTLSPTRPDRGGLPIRTGLDAPLTQLCRVRRNSTPWQNRRCPRPPNHRDTRPGSRVPPNTARHLPPETAHPHGLACGYSPRLARQCLRCLGCQLCLCLGYEHPKCPGSARPLSVACRP
jgi:hypothetical protein